MTDLKHGQNDSKSNLVISLIILFSPSNLIMP